LLIVPEQFQPNSGLGDGCFDAALVSHARLPVVR
jgi:hypothetical protein